MRLIDLHPRLFKIESDGPPVGLSFDCPHCIDQRLAVSFHHAGREAIEDDYIHAHSSETNHIWTLAGDTFENYSLSPSVDASHSGHWHGFLTNGEIK